MSDLSDMLKVSHHGNNVYAHARFHTPSYNGLPVIVIRSKVKGLSLTTSIYLLYILQKYYIDRRCIFFPGPVIICRFRT